MGETALVKHQASWADKDPPRAKPSDRKNKRRERPSSGPESRAGWREPLALATLALLLPRAILPGGLTPAGLAFILTLALSGVDHIFWYTSASLLGLFSVTAPLTALGNAPAYILAALLSRRRTPITKTTWLIMPVVALSMLGHALLAIWMDTLGPYWTLILLDGGLTAALGLMFLHALPVLRHGPLASGGSEERLFLSLIPIALAILGLSRITLFGFNLAAVSSAFMVALLGYLGGPGLGAGMGILLGLAPGLGHAPWPAAGELALSGFLTGLFRHSGRLGMAVGFGAGFGVPYLWHAARAAFAWPMAGQALLGFGAFLALPDQPLRHLGLVMPTGNSWGAAKRAEQARLRDLLSERVTQLAGVFAQLSKAFVANDRENTDRPDLYNLLDQVVQKSCQQCAGFDACWRQNFYASYRELFDLIALAEMNGTARQAHLRGRLATACFQQRKILETVDAVLCRVQAESQLRQQANDHREFVADQLEGVAGIMTGLAKEMRLDVEFRVEVEDRLKASFNRLGLAVESLSVLEYGQDMLEVKIKKLGCLNYFECQYLIAPMVSRILGHAFTVWDKQCPSGSCQDCSFALIPTGRFSVKHAVGRIAKEDGCCGDNHTVMHTKDGRVALILSDGMGTGRKAAQESRATVDLLAQLLSSGLKEEFALNLINSVLMLRTPEERFATVDVALVDLFRGQTELIKVGAAPSYVKRGRMVIPIRATTPPAGILQKIEIDRQRLMLMAGDYLVFVSDGVFAGALGPEETEDWVERALSRVEVAGPEPMVDFLLKIARTNMGSEVKDDVTVIVAQLVPSGTN
ncbi:MAG: stage II sporulation protein E [Bacteroidota bacterium]